MNLNSDNRRETTLVKIGNISVSSKHPVMVQSMLNTSTMDTDACVGQAIRIIEAGGELVRITAQGVKEAENLKNIHAALRAKGYHTPISADIHFNPDAALVAARLVEKVRINPGNFVDKRATFKTLAYTDEEYAEELNRLKEKFTEFLGVCQEYNTAVRIGTNHGSLSDRIMSRYGNTPAGMVEATLEYLRICQARGFENVVISLKSSDCKVMIQAVRLLVAQMEKEGMAYPLHLGVTEAGEGEDGRIRSAVGIGTLLNEGIGDTIRVSLTEEPEKEIPVAKSLAALCKAVKESGNAILGNNFRPVIVADVSSLEIVDEQVTEQLGFVKQKTADPVYGELLRAGIKTPEMIYTVALGPELTKLPGTTTVIVPADIIDMAHVYNRQACPLYSVAEYLRAGQKRETNQVFIELATVDDITLQLVQKLTDDPQVVVILAPEVSYHLYRALLKKLIDNGVKNRVIVKAEAAEEDAGQIRLLVAAHTGGLFIDGLVSGLWIKTTAVPDVAFAVELSRNILQSAGLRRYKTEFVSCPGCGRTLFNLQAAVARVKEAFSHLDTLKIAVMGCVVNGPGEMGDADYGYVGAGNGKVNLYKGRQMVKTAIPEEQAIEALRQLIAENGDWKNPAGK